MELVVADETLEARAANKADSELLNIQIGDPILRIERLSYDVFGDPKEFVVMRYRADEYTYYVRLKRF